MIKRAIRDNPAHNLHGATHSSIANYVRTNFPVPLDGFNARLRAALHRAVENAQLEKVGAGRYKISKNERARDSRRKKRASKAKEGEEGTEKKKRSPKKKSPKKADGEEGKKKKKRSPKKEGEPKKKRLPKKEGEPKKKSPKKGTTTGARKAVKKQRPTKEGAPVAVAAAAAASGETKWVWQFKDGSWYNYDFGASDLVEAVYQDYLKNPGMFPLYCLHFLCS